MLACSVGALDVSQRLVSSNPRISRMAVLLLACHILEFCVTVDVDRSLSLRIAGGLLLLELDLIDLDLPRLAA